MLTVFVSPTGGGQIKVNGTIAKPGLHYIFDSGTTPTVEAIPVNGYIFSHWSGDLNSFSSIDSVIMTCDKTIIANFSQPLVESIPVYYPHIACDDGWETEICLINNSDNTTLYGTFQAHNDRGELLSNSSRMSLAPHGRIELHVNQDFDQATEIGYIIFTAETDTAEDIAGYTKFYIDGRYRVAVPVVTTINQGDIFISHITSSSDWWTGASLVNTTTENKALTLKFDNGVTQTMVLNAKEHKVILMADLFEQGATEAHSAVIRNATGVIGLELFSSGNLLSGILLKDQTATEIYYPHVASDDDWWTGIVAHNPQNDNVDLTITPYDINGSAQETQNITLPGTSNRVDTASSFAFPSNTAWFKISSSGPITGFELFGTLDNTRLAGYTGVGLAQTSGVFAKIEKQGWTGVAFINIASSVAMVTLKAYDDNGYQVTSRTITLNPFQKTVKQAADFFFTNISSATYLSYSANQKIVAFQLNGSDDGMMLDALPGM